MSFILQSWRHTSGLKACICSPPTHSGCSGKLLTIMEQQPAALSIAPWNICIPLLLKAKAFLTRGRPRRSVSCQALLCAPDGRFDGGWLGGSAHESQQESGQPLRHVVGAGQHKCRQAQHRRMLLHRRRLQAAACKNNISFLVGMQRHREVCESVLAWSVMPCLCLPMVALPKGSVGVWCLDGPQLFRRLKASKAAIYNEITRGQCWRGSRATDPKGAFKHNRIAPYHEDCNAPGTLHHGPGTAVQHNDTDTPSFLYPTDQNADIKAHRAPELASPHLSF